MNTWPSRRLGPAPMLPIHSMPGYCLLRVGTPAGTGSLTAIANIKGWAPMAVTFLVKSIFAIKGHGRVIAGEVVEGAIRVGMLAAPEDPAGSAAWEITGIESFRNVTPDESHVALLFAHAPSVAELRRLIGPGSRLHIREA